MTIIQIATVRWHHCFRLIHQSASIITIHVYIVHVLVTKLSYKISIDNIKVKDDNMSCAIRKQSIFIFFIVRLVPV